MIIRTVLRITHYNISYFYITSICDFASKWQEFNFHLCYDKKDCSKANSVVYINLSEIMLGCRHNFQFTPTEHSCPTTDNNTIITRASCIN